jgi:hypothetical protein
VSSLALFSRAEEIKVLPFLKGVNKVVNTTPDLQLGFIYLACIGRARAPFKWLTSNFALHTDTRNSHRSPEAVEIYLPHCQARKYID